MIDRVYDVYELGVTIEFLFCFELRTTRAVVRENTVDLSYRFLLYQ